MLHGNSIKNASHVAHCQTQMRPLLRTGCVEIVLFVCVYKVIHAFGNDGTEFGIAFKKRATIICQFVQNSCHNVYASGI